MCLVKSTGHFTVLSARGFLHEMSMWPHQYALYRRIGRSDSKACSLFTLSSSSPSIKAAQVIAGCIHRDFCSFPSPPGTAAVLTQCFVKLVVRVSQEQADESQKELLTSLITLISLQ